MSGLGTTMSPTGESGSVQGVDMKLDAIITSPASITQNTSVETLDHVIHRDWIWKETVTVSTAMAPGTVFAIMPVHPYECNRFVKHVAEMFNCWTGGMLIRLRMMATAFYGGSIRVGYLPPNLTPTDIRNMPLDVLTVYPNDDFDPKNTTWTHFATPDERDTAYHYIENNVSGWNQDDKRSFGGYIVLYVAGRLVTQSPEMSSINIIVESAGNFNFSQISPHFLTRDVPSGGGSLSGSSLQLENWLPCELPQKFGSIKLGIMPLALSVVPSGGFNMQPLIEVPLKDAPDINIPFEAQMAIDTLVPLKQNFVVGELDNSAGTSYFNGPCGLVSTGVYTVERDFLSVNATTFPFSTFVTPGTRFNSDGSVRYALQDGVGPATPLGPKFSVVQKPTTSFSSFFGHLYTDCTFKPNALNESLVTVFDDGMILPSLQPSLFKAQLKHSGLTDPTTTEIYALRTSEGVTILLLRLNANGVLSTSALPETVIKIEPGMHLQYLQDLPSYSPLPVTSAMRRNLKKLRLDDILRNSPDKLGISPELAQLFF
nr:MAG: coat protein [Avian associated calicivirus 6]